MNIDEELRANLMTSSPTPSTEHNERDSCLNLERNDGIRPTPLLSGKTPAPAHDNLSQRVMDAIQEILSRHRYSIGNCSGRSWPRARTCLTTKMWTNQRTARAMDSTASTTSNRWQHRLS